MLFTADSLAACLAGAIAVLALNLISTQPQGVTYVAGATILWPLAAFSIGLYRSDQLASWASAVTEIPRAFVALMLITWPLFGLASILGLDHVVALTFVTVAGMAVLTGVARTAARAALHRLPGPAPAHADPRLGHGGPPGGRAPAHNSSSASSRSASSTTTCTRRRRPRLPCWVASRPDRVSGASTG